MRFPVRIPFVEALGVELLTFEAGSARLALTLRDDQLNSWNVAHGGVTMTLLDVAMAHAARSPNQPGHPTSQGVVTLEMKTTFMRPARGRLVATARVLHRTATLAFCEASIDTRDAAAETPGEPSDRLCVAHATGTFKYVRALASGTRSTTSSKAPPQTD
jgi:uncharacterized protein (TIGR00369 family)